MNFLIFGFVLSVIASVIYLHRDHTQWKLVSDRLSLFTSNFTNRLGEVVKLAREADESNKALRTALMAQKVVTDNLEDHNHRMQQSILLLEGKLRIVQDQVVGFKVNLPENISVSFTKDVKNAATRSQQRKAESKKPDNKVRRKRAAPGASPKRNVRVSSNK